jgi:multiple antibiotic resistance protein
MPLFFMHYLCGMNISEILTVSFTLFAVIDMLGSVPVIISLRAKSSITIQPLKVTLASAALMIGFLFAGEYFLKYLGIDKSSFALAGSIVMFILGLEMVLGVDIFRTDPDAPGGSVVPVAFPIIAGSGTLTTILSLKVMYDEVIIAIGILANLVFIYLALHSTSWLEKKISKAGLLTIRKFFGVILLAIAVKIFRGNL